MAIAAEITILQAQLWPQGDARDPLGVWGCRLAVTGDATGGGTKVGMTVPANRAGAYMYTAYSVTVAQISGTLYNDAVKCRLLTNWPDVDALAGIQGFATAINRQGGFGGIAGSANYTPPIAAMDRPLLLPNDRFILLYDPRARSTDLTIVEVEVADNLDLAVLSFEGYGYFWDRSVFLTPGGPRHPGSS